MSRADELRALLARVEAADRGSYAIDEAINAWRHSWHISCRFVNLLQPTSPPPAFTTSLDAAVRLIEEILPEWSWEVRRSGFGHVAQGCLWDPRVSPAPGVGTRVDHASGVPALTLIAVLLSALISQEGENVVER